MAGRNKRRPPNYYARALSQKKRIERYYDCFKCKINGRGYDSKLICKGSIQPTDLSRIYELKLLYDGAAPPRVHVIDPVIPYDIDAHMYSDKSLCLYYPKDNPWKHTMSIADTIIPWTAEWLVYYELYQIDGKWHGPFVPHGNQTKKAG